MQTSKSKTTAEGILGLWTLALTSFIIAALYFARHLLIPLSLAALLTFLLAPLVTRLERWLGRVGAVLLVVALIFAATGAAGYVLTRQLIDLATKRRFANNAFLKARGLRFYAGPPLRAASGQPIGSLCLLDTKPRQLTDREKRLLQEYATEVTEEIASRSTLRHAAPALTG